MSVLSFVDKNEHSKTLFVLIAITYGFYVLGIASIVEPNPRNPDAYQNFAGIPVILESGSLNFKELSVGYRNWPAANLILCSLMLITGITEQMDFIRHISLAWPMLFIMIAYTIGARFDLSPKQTFVLSLVPLASTLGWDDYPSTILGHCLLFLCIALLLSNRSPRKNGIVIAILMGGIVITHAIMGAALVLSTFAFFLFRKTTVWYFALVVAFMATWYLHMASFWITGFLFDLSTLWLRILVIFFSPSTYETVGPTPIGRLLLRYGNVIFFITYALLGFRHLFWVVFHLRDHQDLRLQKSLFTMMVIIVVPLAIVIPIGESIARMIVMNSVWVILLLLITTPRKWVIVGLLLILPLVLPFLRYSAEGSWGYVGTTMLYGAEFLGTRTDPQQLQLVNPLFQGEEDLSLFAYHGVPSLVIHANPSYFGVPFEGSVSFDRPYTDPGDIDRISHPRIRYVAINQQGHEQALWSVGANPFDVWEDSEKAQAASKIYSSGYFRIYKNPEAISNDPLPG